MTQTTHSSLLTAENLKAFSSPPTLQYPAPPSSIISGNDDTASLFSAADSAISSTSSAPEDEEAPYGVQASTGESITVYQSPEQAVRYSLLRVEQERRSEDESMRFAYCTLTATTSSSASREVVPTSSAWETGFGEGAGDVDGDEDAYFSMG